MPSRKQAKPKQRDTGNYVAEWFGHRVFPVVAATPESLKDQRGQTCPFLSEATGTKSECVKPDTSKGICTVSSIGSNKLRQDWLVCPFRGLDHPLVDDVARRLFGIPAELGVTALPGPSLKDARKRADFKRHVTEGGAGVIYLQSKLGGEISISPTDRSPELSFDFTLVEVRHDVPSLPGGEPRRGTILPRVRRDIRRRLSELRRQGRGRKQVLRWLRSGACCYVCACRQASAPCLARVLHAQAPR